MKDDKRTARYRNWYWKLLTLYPTPYQERFKEPMEQTFHDLLRERTRSHTNLFSFVLWTFVETSRGIIREQLAYNTMKVSLIKQTSAWLPIGMSAAALALLLGYVFFFGIQEPSGDEGTAARIFQLLIIAQLPIIGFFLLKWGPQAPKQALLILALQFIGALIPVLTVFYLERGLY